MFYIVDDYLLRRCSQIYLDSQSESSEDQDASTLESGKVIEEVGEPEEDTGVDISQFTEYVYLRGSTFHQDCQHGLKRCRK